MPSTRPTPSGMPSTISQRWSQPSTSSSSTLRRRLRNVGLAQKIKTKCTSYVQFFVKIFCCFLRKYVKFLPQMRYFCRMCDILQKLQQQISKNVFCCCKKLPNYAIFLLNFLTLFLKRKAFAYIRYFLFGKMLELSIVIVNGIFNGLIFG